MTADVTVRPAEADDADAVQRVARAAWHEAYDAVLGPDRVDETVAEWYDPERLVADDVTAEDRPFFVATVGDRVVGFAEAVPDGDDESLAHLYRIYVAPDRWGEGVGSELLDRIEAVLRDEGFDRAQLSVMAKNDVGVSFYESKGFERVATTENDRFDIREHVYAKPLTRR